MDQVFFLIKAHEVYVGEYYKNQIKQVKFKDKDFWEVFDQHDFIEFIEHMNYPMNYNEFKNNKVRIVYDHAQKYEMLYQVQGLFNKATDVKVGEFLPYIKKAYTVKCQEEILQSNKQYIVYEQTYYKIMKTYEAIDPDLQVEAQDAQKNIELQVLNELELDELDIQEESVCLLTTEEVCKALFEDDTRVVTLGEYYPVLAPVNLYKEGTTWGKQKFLETHHIVDTVTRVQQGSAIKNNDVIFNYTKVVNKLFSKKQTQCLQKKSSKEGLYYDYYQESASELWATKGQLIGVIGDDVSKEVLEEWLDKTGFI